MDLRGLAVGAHERQVDLAQRAQRRHVRRRSCTTPRRPPPAYPAEAGASRARAPGQGRRRPVARCRSAAGDRSCDSSRVRDPEDGRAPPVTPTARARQGQRAPAAARRLRRARGGGSLRRSISTRRRSISRTMTVVSGKTISRRFSISRAVRRRSRSIVEELLQDLERRRELRRVAGARPRGLAAHRPARLSAWPRDWPASFMRHHMLRFLRAGMHQRVALVAEHEHVGRLVGEPGVDAARGHGDDVVDVARRRAAALALLAALLEHGEDRPSVAAVRARCHRLTWPAPPGARSRSPSGAR